MSSEQENNVQPPNVGRPLNDGQPSKPQSQTVDALIKRGHLPPRPSRILTSQPPIDNNSSVLTLSEKWYESPLFFDSWLHKGELCWIAKVVLMNGHETIFAVLKLVNIQPPVAVIPLIFGFFLH